MLMPLLGLLLGIFMALCILKFGIVWIPITIGVLVVAALLRILAGYLFVHN